jgi:hypothetical protein
MPIGLSRAPSRRSATSGAGSTRRGLGPAIWSSSYAGNGLLPDYLGQSFDQLIATLQSGLPKVRNEVAGHGQGATPRETPGYVAGYALHLAAVNIVLLVEAMKATEH